MKKACIFILTSLLGTYAYCQSGNQQRPTTVSPTIYNNDRGIIEQQKKKHQQEPDFAQIPTAHKVSLIFNTNDNILKKYKKYKYNPMTHQYSSY